MGNFQSKKPNTQIEDPFYISEDMREQILLKLPPKSLVRFTCVSKSCLSLIKSPTFINNHTKHSIASQNENPLLLLSHCSNLNQPINTSYSMYDLYFEEEEEGGGGYTYYMFYSINFCFWVLGTINGLLCLDSNTQTIIWNPAIKRLVTLPKPTFLSLRLGLACISYYDCISLGFGFDSRSNDYRVFRLAKLFFPVQVSTEGLDTLQAEIYSLNMNSWRTVDVPRVGYEVRYPNRSVFVNGKMHVVAFRGDHNLVLVFDMGNEEFTEMELPPSLAYENSASLRLLVYKESIALFEQDWVGPPGPGGPGPGAYVWVMEEYGVVESWTRILSFNREEGNWPNLFGDIFSEELRNWPYLIGFRKNGELFLQRTNQENHEVVSYEPNTQVVKHLGVGGRSPFIDYFVRSLELLDNANAQSYLIDQF